jgi:ABC transporter DrrB family efflux protein
MSDAAAIETHALARSFGAVRALDGIDLVVGQGQVFGLLGPNGAGKTTLVRILATLLTPDAGTARVLGLDVQRDAAALRQKIGLAGQYAAVDENLTGLENLTMFGRLYGASRRSARARGRELLESFDLIEAAGRPTKTYSGGMRRRLDLAAALVAEPPVLFLDEPTTGLDPRSRLSKGLIDRFRSLPMSRAAVLGGRTLADVATNALSITILLVTGVIIGFSFQTSFAHAAAGIGLLLLFGYGFSWFLAFLGLLVSSPESVNSVGFIAVFPLTFISSAFVPVASMPDGLRQFAEYNPFTIIVDAIRSLWLGAPADNYVWGAVAWSLAIVAVFAPQAVARYRRAAGA